MSKKLFFILVLLAIPLISADVTMPGIKGISINNEITNINEFPEYVFISGPDSGGGGLGLSMCGLRTIGEDGKIGGYYKFCMISVYAVLKENFDQETIDEINSANNHTFRQEKWEEIKSVWEMGEVISNIETYHSVPISNPTEEINRYYQIDLGELKTDPDNTDIKHDYSLYLYPLISLISLIIIIYILIKRKKEDK